MFAVKASAIAFISVFGKSLGEDERRVGMAIKLSNFGRMIGVVTELANIE